MLFNPCQDVKTPYVGVTMNFQTGPVGLSDTGDLYCMGLKMAMRLGSIFWTQQKMNLKEIVADGR